jgi:hypothetical protein
MAQQNKTTLQSAINAQIADNTSGNITAANVRNNFINLTDSLVFNTGSQAITGSLTVTGGVTGSLLGTATNAVTALTASFINGTNTKTYSYFRSDYSYPTTASIVRHILPIFPSTFSSIDLTISKYVDYTSAIPIVIQLYASKNNSYTINTISYDDVLIGTYSASLPSHVTGNWPTYRLKRSFYQSAFSEGEPGYETTSFYFYGANATASILSDESSSILKELVLAAGPENTYIYPNLKITGQSSAGGPGATLFSLGPVRVTF